MRVLIGHNHYKIPGGEDAVFKAEHTLLQEMGEDVTLYTRHNKEIDEGHFLQKINMLRELSWSKRSYREVRSLIKKFKPHIAHFHNIFFLLTPSVYAACKDEGVPVVQSQHNFRLFCSNGLFYRDHNVCEDCLNKSLWQGVFHRCFRQSTLLTAAIATMLMKHWKKGTWTNMVDTYVTATQFSRQKLIAGGIPDDKIVVKPHFQPKSVTMAEDRGYALYVGRLSEEKGVDVLIKAWSLGVGTPLKIIGQGPLDQTLRKMSRDDNLDQIEFLGFVKDEEFNKYLQGAKFLIIPSRCYENFPRIVAEAFAYGVPIIASRLGSLGEIIDEGKNGLLFHAGDATDLRNKVKQLVEQRFRNSEMRQAARQKYESHLSAKKNYEDLIKIYQKAMDLERFRGKR